MIQQLFEIAEVKISYNFGKCQAERKKITSSEDAYLIAKEFAADYIEYKEVFSIILLNNANNVLGVAKISEGGITATLVDLRILFQHILKANATSFIAVHNHPSGKLKASEADKKLTSKIQKASEVLDIMFLDHIIITTESYYSFADEGLF